ncbi:uncharacterized protein LOC142729739 [Rhinoderma darwinii]|uniref:uncharacterized protein LOC142729739 n=1 Tax=Rhinoderma darwinii TaxID=43563 RepID=UPI003F6676B2
MEVDEKSDNEDEEEESVVEEKEEEEVEKTVKEQEETKEEVSMAMRRIQYCDLNSTVQDGYRMAAGSRSLEDIYRQQESAFGLRPFITYPSTTEERDLQRLIYCTKFLPSPIFKMERLMPTNREAQRKYLPWPWDEEEPKPTSSHLCEDLKEEEVKKEEGEAEEREEEQVQEDHEEEDKEEEDNEVEDMEEKDKEESKEPISQPGMLLLPQELNKKALETVEKAIWQLNRQTLQHV